MKNPIHIAVLDLYNQFPNEGMRCIKQLLEELTASNSLVKKVDYFDVRAKGEFPNPNEYDIFISSGGPGDPKLKGEHWEDKYVKLVEPAADHLSEFSHIHVLVENLKYGIFKSVEGV